eukprot:2194833-Prymnesium_polylepis.1
MLGGRCGRAHLCTGPRIANLLGRQLSCMACKKVGQLAGRFFRRRRAGTIQRLLLGAYALRGLDSHASIASASAIMEAQSVAERRGSRLTLASSSTAKPPGGASSAPSPLSAPGKE